MSWRSGAAEPRGIANSARPARSRARAPTRSTPILKSAIDNNRIDLYLQPVVTLPQRKVRYYEAMTRLRTEDGTLILPSDFLAHAEKSGADRRGSTMCSCSAACRCCGGCC